VDCAEIKVATNTVVAGGIGRRRPVPEWEKAVETRSEGT